MKKVVCYPILAISLAFVLVLSVEDVWASESEKEPSDFETNVWALNFDMNVHEGVIAPEIKISKSTQGSNLTDPYFDSYFEPYTFKPIESRESVLEESDFTSQISRGGLSLSVARVMVDPFPDDDNYDIEWNEMKFHINNYNRSATFDIFAVKQHKTIPHDRHSFRWVIAVPAGGLRSGPINQTPFTYKFYARGQDIEIISFEINGRPVEYFFHGGELNPLAKIYSPHNDDCIEIDVLVELDGDGKIKSPSPQDLRFCAGSCSGFLLAATK